MSHFRHLSQNSDAFVSMCVCEQPVSLFRGKVQNEYSGIRRQAARRKDTFSIEHIKYSPGRRLAGVNTCKDDK